MKKRQKPVSEVLARKIYAAAQAHYPTPLPPFDKMTPHIREAWLEVVRKWVESMEGAKE